MGDIRKHLATPSEKDFGSNGANISGTEIEVSSDETYGYQI